VICNQPEFIDNEFDTVLNPTLIIKILSAYTAAYDKGMKFELYREIPSLKEYITVDSTKIHIEQFISSNNNTWTLQEYKNPEVSFVIPCINMPVLVADWYKEVEFK
jgi:Uma2 family endonuclease